jgi:hypothetical protein
MNGQASPRPRGWGALDALAAISRSLPAIRGKKRAALALMRRAEARGQLGGTWKDR